MTTLLYRTHWNSRYHTKNVQTSNPSYPTRTGRAPIPERMLLQSLLTHKEWPSFDIRGDVTIITLIRKVSTLIIHIGRE